MLNKTKIKTYTEFYNLIDYLATLPNFPVIKNSKCWIEHPLSEEKRWLVNQYQYELGNQFIKPILRVFDILIEGRYISYVDRTQCSNTAIVEIIRSHFVNVEQIKDKRTGVMLFQREKSWQN